jgi:hypothetical protein
VVSVEYADVWQATIEMEKWADAEECYSPAVMRTRGERNRQDPHFEVAGVRRIPISSFADSLKG